MNEELQNAIGYTEKQIKACHKVMTLYEGRGDLLRQTEKLEREVIVHETILKILEQAAQPMGDRGAALADLKNVKNSLIRAIEIAADDNNSFNVPTEVFVARNILEKETIRAALSKPLEDDVRCSVQSACSVACKKFYEMRNPVDVESLKKDIHSHLKTVGTDKDVYTATISDGIIDHLNKQHRITKPGFVVVPLEPTEAMLTSAAGHMPEDEGPEDVNWECQSVYRSEAYQIYKAMIKAY